MLSNPPPQPRRSHDQGLFPSFLRRLTASGGGRCAAQAEAGFGDVVGGKGGAGDYLRVVVWPVY